MRRGVRILGHIGRDLNLHVSSFQKGIEAGAQWTGGGVVWGQGARLPLSDVPLELHPSASAAIPAHSHLAEAGWGWWGSGVSC